VNGYETPMTASMADDRRHGLQAQISFPRRFGRLEEFALFWWSTSWPI
jgi:hypothetical protein